MNILLGTGCCIVLTLIVILIMEIRKTIISEKKNDEYIENHKEFLEKIVESFGKE